MKNWRLWFVAGILLTSYVILAGNIYILQIKKGGYYLARAESQNRLTDFVQALRGNIYFKDKNDNQIAAAINKGFPVIYAVPKEIEDAKEAAAQLSPILKTKAAVLEELFLKPDDLYELLVEKSPPAQVSAIESLGIKGIYVDVKNFRFYPFANLASHLLGFVGKNEESQEPDGRYGLESFYNDSLKDQEEIKLTIDRNIQAQAEKVLKNLVDRFSALGGTAIVQEPKTGKILAMANYPTFDPNNYSEYPVKNFLNPAVQSVYEPGSVFKILTMSAGIDAGKITPNTTYTDTGSVILNSKTISNWDGKAYGRITMTGVIENSVNTGAIFAERKTGHDNFYNYIIKFGFDEITGIELPGEVSGNLKNLRTSFRDINFATAAFGQGVSVTPLQLINAVSAIANRGILMRPQIVDGSAPEEIRRVISSDTAEAVTEMMTSAVTKAEIAHIPGYEIAAKTGTAQVPDLRRGGYLNEFIHSYVGFAPASDPRFTILLKLDRPKGASLAGATVVPAFRELAQFVINYYNIPADDLR